MTRTTSQTKTADQIANDHGCAIVPGAFGRDILQVLGYYRQGDPLDKQRIATCRKALVAAGYAQASRYLS